ncbi:hypothetical protein GF324_11385 [bacterium]|nr:hypothetical protein [bacterium]
MHARIWKRLCTVLWLSLFSSLAAVPLVHAQTGRTVRNDEQPAARPRLPEFVQPNDRQKAMNEGRSARRMEIRGQYEHALNIYRRLLEQFPEEESFFRGVLRNLTAMGNYAEAIKILDDKITLAPPHRDMSEWYIELGRVQYLDDQKQAAEVSWAKAKAESPYSSHTYTRLSNAFLRLRLVDRAVEVLYEGRKAIDDSTLFAVNLANLFQSRMNWDGAAREHLNSVRAHPGRKGWVIRSLANVPADSAATSAVQSVVMQERQRARQFSAMLRHIPRIAGPASVHKAVGNLDREIKRLPDEFAGDVRKRPVASVEKNRTYPRFSMPRNEAQLREYEQILVEILAGQAMKNGNFAEALRWELELDAQAVATGERLLDFARDVHAEGADSIAFAALEHAQRRLSNPLSRAQVDIILAGMLADRGEFAEADSILTTLIKKENDPFVRRKALMERGLIALEGTLEYKKAARDFERVLSSLRAEKADPRPEEEAGPRFALAVAHARMGKLEAAAETTKDLMTPVPTGPNRPPRMPVEPGSQLFAEVGYLRARLAWWRGDLERAGAILDSMVYQPTGADPENDMLEAAQRLTMLQQDSTVAHILAEADQALYSRNREKALELLTPLAEEIDTPTGKEAAWLLAQMELNTAATSSPAGMQRFAETYPDDPRAEEAWLLTGHYHRANGDLILARQAYENLVITYPNGLLTAEARLYLDQLAGVDMPPLVPTMPMQP